jgi:hypothetical protein
MDAPESPSTSAETVTALAQFDALKAHLNQWYYQPDIEAVEVVMGTVASHYTKADPVWLFVVAPPSTGKTAIAIQSARLAPSAHIVGDLTPNTLLSAREGTKRPPSLLERIGKSGIILMKDFSTVISKRPDDRAALASQLREVYDGYFAKDTGMGSKLIWEGKITLIAATTPAIERQWALLRELGERFVTIRWDRESARRSTEFSLRQRGLEASIGLRTAQLAAHMFQDLAVDVWPDLPSAQIDRICALAEVVALARNHVVRDYCGARSIIETPQAEGSSRIAKALCAIVTGYAALFHREVVEEDMRLAVRVAANTIPYTRWSILANLPLNAELSHSDLSTLSQLSKGTLSWQMEELAAMNLVSETNVANKTTYAYTEHFREIWSVAFPHAH